MIGIPLAPHDKNMDDLPKKKKIHKVKESEVETAEGYDQVEAHHCKWSMYDFLYQSLYTIHLDPLSFCKAVINNIDTKDKRSASDSESNGHDKAITAQCMKYPAYYKTRRMSYVMETMSSLLIVTIHANPRF